LVLRSQLCRQRSKARRRISILVVSEGGVLKRVEHINPELHPALALADAEVLLQRDVKVSLHWRPNLQNPSAAALRPFNRAHERRRIDVGFALIPDRTIPLPQRILQRRPRRNVEADVAVYATQTVRVGDIRQVRIPALQAKNAGGLPAAQPPVYHPPCVLQGRPSP